MSESVDIAKLEFKYRRLSAEQKLELLERLRERVEDVSGVLFAYVYGGFVERDSFRDVDVAVWIGSVGDAFYYTVDFSAELEVEIGIPVDVQVLNEAPLPFKHYVFTKGRLLFSKDENLRLRLVEEVVRQHIDLRQLKRLLYSTVDFFSFLSWHSECVFSPRDCATFLARASSMSSFSVFISFVRSIATVSLLPIFASSANFSALDLVRVTLIHPEALRSASS